MLAVYSWSSNYPFTTLHPLLSERRLIAFGLEERAIFSREFLKVQFFPDSLPQLHVELKAADLRGFVDGLSLNIYRETGLQDIAELVRTLVVYVKKMPDDQALHSICGFMADVFPKVDEVEIACQAKPDDAPAVSICTSLTLQGSNSRKVHPVANSHRFDDGSRFECFPGRRLRRTSRVDVRGVRTHKALR